MSRAPRISRLLAAAGPAERETDLWRALETGDCEGSVHHSPRPLLVHRYSLADPLDGILLRLPEDATTPWSVRLCGTCVDNLGLYLTLLLAYEGVPPEAVKRDFGNPIRALGGKAWDLLSASNTERDQDA